MRTTLKSFFAYCAVGLFTIVSFASCSSDSYINAIPGDVTALLAVNTPKSFIDYKGVDMGSDVYLFEDADGNLGACVNLSDGDALAKYFNEQSGKGICSKVEDKRGFHFSLLSNGFLAGFSDDALLLMGPIVEADKAEYINRMAKLLKQDEEQSVKSSRMYDALDSIEGPMRLVARVDALPQQFVTPFMLGAPKTASPSQVYVMAKMKSHDGVLDMQGHTFSFNNDIETAIRNANKVYRPIKGRYINSMPQDAMLGLFVNVDGTKFIDVMRNNQGLQAMLTGINRAIDMDNIIKSVNGDMSIVMSTYSPDRLQMSMAAQLANSNWLSDVDYWKESAPEGSTIADWGKNSYIYSDSKTTYCFGVTDDLQYYSGGNQETALNSIKPSVVPLSDNLQKMIKGQKLVMVVNLNLLTGKQGTIVQALKPILGNVSRIMYRLD
ncbi:MAG: DUF4836 family protein [Prevotella sp.]|jgi:hypothetical protein